MQKYAIRAIVCGASIWLAGCSTDSKHAGNGQGGSGVTGGVTSTDGGGNSAGGAGADTGAGGTTTNDTLTTTTGGSTGADAVDAGCPAFSEFASWPLGAAPSDIGKLAVSNFSSHTGDDYGTAGYAWTFAYFGSLQFTRLTGDNTTNAQLIQDFEPYASSQQPGPDNSATATVDTRAFGDLPLEIYLENGDARCESLGLERADAQWAATTTDGITTDARYWIDDMYMITGLQVYAYRATNDSKYLDRAGKTMLAYIAALQQSDGLFWHTQQSHAYWGRANGWVASGMTMLLLELPAGPTRDSVLLAYQRQMDALVANQITSGADAGCWRQVIDVPAAQAESSCTAMFTYALVTGLKNGWISGAQYVTAAHNGWIALGNKTNSSGMLDRVCPGTGQADPGDLASQQQFYLNIPLGSNDQHGQAPLLWAATALLRTDCPGLR